MFKAGDKVRVLDDNQRGRVIGVHKTRVTIVNEFGFEETYSATELIPDKSFEVDSVVIKTESVEKLKTKETNREETKEIDLHIGQLVDSYRNMSNYDMLQIQLAKIKEEMDSAISQKRKKLIFIHGHGKGKLKEEMMALLKKNYKNIKTYDASFRKFNGGATVVEF